MVQHGLEERRTPGNTLAVQPDKPYQGLSMFGTGECTGCYHYWTSFPELSLIVKHGYCFDYDLFQYEEYIFA